MKHKIFFLLLSILTAGVWSVSPAQGTAFMYQGRLADGGAPANGSYDLRFTLYDAVTNGNAISFPQTNLAVAVSSGVFMQALDFGSVFTGKDYWLAIGVRTNANPDAGTNAFTVLWPRQPVLPVPYAVFANSASNLLGKLATAQLAGTLSSTQLAGTYSIPVSFTNTGNVFAGTFTGDGSSIVNLNGSAVAFGTVADTHLSTNVALLNTNQTFTGTNVFTGVNTFSNWTNSFTGSFFGNGLVGWVPVSNTSTQAMRDTGYLLLNSSLSTVTLPVDADLMVGDIVRISGAGAGGWRVPQISGQSILGNFSGYASSGWAASSAAASSWISLASSADGLLMAAASFNSSAVYTSTDYGHTWSQSGSASAIWHSVAVAGDGSRMLAGQASSGYIYYSTNRGSTWTGGGTTGNWYSLAMSDNGSNAVAVSSTGPLYTSMNGGVSWQARTGNSNWQAVASSASGANLIAAVYGGRICTSSNFGTNWTTQTGAPSTNWSSVTSSADGSKLAAVAYGGGIYTSGDFGVTWTKQAGALTATNWGSITSSDDGSHLAAVVYNGGIYISSDFGATWTAQSAPVRSWLSICGSADGSRLAAGVYNPSTGGIYYSAATTQTSTTVGTSGYLAGPQGSAVELQYIGNNRWIRVSSSGPIGAN